MDHKSVAIVGAGKYFGAALFHNLTFTARDVQLVSFLRRPFSHQHHRNSRDTTSRIMERDSNQTSMNTERLRSFDVVIFLASDGCDDNHIQERAVDNTTDDGSNKKKKKQDNVLELVSRMKQHQTLVLVTSASACLVKSSACAQPASESDVRTIMSPSPSSPSASRSEPTECSCIDATRSTADGLRHRVRQDDSPNIVELRMGSLAGTLMSHHQCLNRPLPHLHQLVRTAYVQGYVPSTYANVYHPVVWLPDAVRAIQAVVESSWSLPSSLPSSLPHHEVVAEVAELRRRGGSQHRAAAGSYYQMYHVTR
jgi:hypothetical protein